MLEEEEILNLILEEKELALKRIRLLDEIIDIIQTEGLSNRNVEHLRTFLNDNNRRRNKKVVRLSSKMNDQADLIDKYSGYDTTKNIKDKIFVILKTEKQFLHIREIGEILVKLEFESSKKTEDYIKNISPVLSIMAKSGDRICKVSEDGNKKSTIWGLIEWTENGEPINDYLIK